MQTKGLNTLTLLQQIRLWIKARSGGKQYHDCENDLIIEPYFDISPEATLPADIPDILLEEIR
ncbi:hypothetical protein [Methanoculleus sp. UBA208]|uniref:hypothetical protein n=1 Tax=Methanoculleus sp. UBA208 TaxID=1915494 RepID=UPI0025DD828F|nr:hypothetical protein [Methanoculleus sp. UBA208]